MIKNSVLVMFRCASASVVLLRESPSSPITVPSLARTGTNALTYWLPPIVTMRWSGVPFSRAPEKSRWLSACDTVAAEPNVVLDT